MQRYLLCDKHLSEGGGGYMEEDSDGDWVRYDDAQAEITRLTAERDDWAYKYNESCNTYSAMHVALEKAEDERDQALARAAAAAMEMRERSASVTVDLGPRYDGRPVHYHIPENVQSVIRALPIDPDAQQALDKLLAQAREDAIRLSASIAEAWKAFDGEDYRPVKAVILDLLNDGGRDE